MFIIKIVDGSIQEPQSVKDVQDQAKGILKFQDCFVADNYERADAFVIKAIDVRKAHIFATETQAKLYASFLRDAGFNQHKMIVQRLIINLEDKFTFKKDESKTKQAGKNKESKGEQNGNN